MKKKIEKTLNVFFTGIIAMIFMSSCIICIREIFKGQAMCAYGALICFCIAAIEFFNVGSAVRKWGKKSIDITTGYVFYCFALCVTVSVLMTFLNITLGKLIIFCFIADIILWAAVLIFYKRIPATRPEPVRNTNFFVNEVFAFSFMATFMPEVPFIDDIIMGTVELRGYESKQNKLLWLNLGSATLALASLLLVTFGMIDLFAEFICVIILSSIFFMTFCLNKVNVKKIGNIHIMLGILTLPEDSYLYDDELNEEEKLIVAAALAEEPKDSDYFFNGKS